MKRSLHPEPSPLPPETGTRRRTRWYRIFPWILLGLAFATVLFGTWGYYIYLPGTQDSPVSDRFGNSLYFTFQLFALHSGFYHDFVKHAVPWQLGLGRWTAAAASFGAVIYAIVAFFLSLVSKHRIRGQEHHVIVCGLGRWTIELIERLVKKGKKVHVIEKDPNDPLIPVCMRKGVPVIVGDASTEAVLEMAGLRGADCVIAFTNDDTVNMETTFAVRDLFKRWSIRAADCPVCYTHLVDRELMQALEQQLNLAQPGGPEVHLFNNFEIAARLAIDDAVSRVEPERIETFQSFHLILFGLSAMGESIVLHTARNCQFRPARMLRITIVEPDESKVEGFLARYPALPDLCVLDRRTTVGFDEDTRFLIEEACRDDLRIVHVAVCLESDNAALDVVLRLPRIVVTRRIPVYLWLSSPEGLAHALEGTAGSDTGLPGEVRVFGLPKQCAGPDAIMRPEIDELANAIHDDYRIVRLRKQLEKKGAAVPPEIQNFTISSKELDKRIQEDPELKEKRAMRPWSDLSENLRNSNRLQADHIPFKLLAAGWYSAEKPADPGDSIVDLSQFDERGEEDDNPIKLLADLEHRRWFAERRLAGWVPGDAEESDPILRETPHLVPWDQLPESIKDYDRQTAVALPRHLRRLRLELYRRRRKEEGDS